MLEDNYAVRAFTNGAVSVFSGIILFPAAAIFGTVLLNFVGGVHVLDFQDFCFEMVFTTGAGMLSGIGLLLIGIDIWYMFKLRHDATSPVECFLVVAACQIGLTVCSTIVTGTFFLGFAGCVIALIIVGLLYLCAIRVRKYLEASSKGCRTP